ncbi:reverse transcriptase domain-containing protein [Tanacetum coccineum]
MTTAPTDGKVSSGSLPVCERCFTRHVGQCTIKCHKCGKVGHKARYCKEKNVATGANAQPILTCYDCGEQGHTRNRCPRKVKQEEMGEVHGRAYAIKDAEPQGPNVVTVTLLVSCLILQVHDHVLPNFSNRVRSILKSIGTLAHSRAASKLILSCSCSAIGFTCSCMIACPLSFDALLLMYTSAAAAVLTSWLAVLNFLPISSTISVLQYQYYSSPESLHPPETMKFLHLVPKK